MKQFKLRGSTEPQQTESDCFALLLSISLETTGALLFLRH